MTTKRPKSSKGEFAGKNLSRPKKKASQKVLSAASHLKAKTKKLVDDVFLKLVGTKVLERAEEMTQVIRKEGAPRRRARK